MTMNRGVLAAVAAVVVIGGAAYWLHRPRPKPVEVVTPAPEPPRIVPKKVDPPAPVVPKAETKTPAKKSPGTSAPVSAAFQAGKRMNAKVLGCIISNFSAPFSHHFCTPICPRFTSFLYHAAKISL